MSGYAEDLSNRHRMEFENVERNINYKVQADAARLESSCQFQRHDDMIATDMSPIC